MSNSINKPSVGFWVISIIGLIWNAMGANQYIQQTYQTDAFKAMYSEEQLTMIQNSPSWAVGAFAVAVFGGLLGCILLLLRKKLAKTVFLISLVGIIVQMIYNLFMTNALEVYGPGGIIMPIMILIIGLFLLWYSKNATAKGWLS
jgi:hypothetical protein